MTRAGATRVLRRNAGRLTAIALVGAALVANLPDGIDAGERRALADRFHFTQVALPDARTDAPARTIRRVNPSLARIDAWISAVGAGIALADLDGNGREDDACQTDPRFDTASVYPVPGTGARYSLRLLDPRPLRYDARTMAPMGCVPADLDEDGRLDLLVYYWGRTPVEFLRRGDGYAPRELVAAAQRWNTNAATFADVDGDGHLDIVIGNYFRDGDRVLDARATDTVSMQESMSRATNGGTDRILLWAGPGRFREARGALSREVADGWTLAAGAQDLDGDLLPEIYLSNDFGHDRLLDNRSTPGHVRLVPVEGDRGIGDASSKVVGQDSFKGMGIDFGDLNSDGLPDMFVSNIAQEWALMESHFAWMSTGDIGLFRRGKAPYRDKSEDVGLARGSWGWDTRLDDLDNDGTLEALQATGFLRGDVDRWPELQELAIGNDRMLPDADHWPRFGPGADLSGHDRDSFYARGPDGRFHDLAVDVGFGRRQVSRGIATADVDADGDLDFAVANQWDRSYLYRNDCPATCGRSLELRLRLPAGAGTRPATGAEVAVRLPGGRRLVRQVDGGNGHSGKRGPELSFGLGRAASPVAVTVRWRDAAGRPRSLERRLAPGRHTLLLGGSP